MALTTALDRLPVEIWQNIIEKLDPICECKSLRLASRGAANSALISSVLFRKLTLHSIPEQVKFLESLDVTRIAPYVQQICFMPYPFPRTVSYDEYLMMAGYMPAIERGPLLEGVSKSYETFKKYIEEAESCIQSDRLRHLWVRTLQKFLNVREIQIGFSEYKRVQPFGNGISQSYGDHLYYLSEANSRARKSTPLYITIKRARQHLTLLQNVFHCLAVAKTKLKSLDLTCHLPGNVIVSEISEISKLDFSQLEKFKVQIHFGINYPKESYRSTKSSIHNLVQAVGNQLTELHINAKLPSTFTWPIDTDIVYPNLKYFAIRRVSIYPAGFARFLHNQKKLAHIKIGRIWLKGSRHSSKIRWMPFFDGLRTHPNTLRVELEKNCLSLYRHESADFRTNPEVWLTRNFEGKVGSQVESFQDQEPEFMSCMQSYVQNHISRSHFVESFPKKML